MSDNLENFIVDVSSNPRQLSRFSTNPQDVVAESALNDAERAQVMSKDSQVLADAMGETGYSLGQIIDEITPMRAPSRKRPSKKAPPKRKAPKKGPARKKAPARKKNAPVRRKNAPARRKGATKGSPARKKAPAKRAVTKRPSRKSAARKRR